jgi:hypothetical protein
MEISISLRSPMVGLFYKPGANSATLFKLPGLLGETGSFAENMNGTVDSWQLFKGLIWGRSIIKLHRYTILMLQKFQNHSRIKGLCVKLFPVPETKSP